MEKIDERHLHLVKRSRNFDSDWYLQEYPDVGALGLDPAYHYLWLGARIGRKPSAYFPALATQEWSLDHIIRRLDRSTDPEHVIAPDALAHFAAPQPTRRVAEFIDEHRIPNSTIDGMRVAVHAHMYYAELADEFLSHLNNIPCKFSLFVSVSSEQDRQIILSKFNNIINVDKLDIRIVQNIGRDIAPFLVEFGSELAKYDVISHIQTKKSLYNNGSTGGWRESILNALFEDSSKISSYLSALKSGRYGIIYPQCFWNLPYVANTWLANSGLARFWASRFGVAELPDGYFDFPTGSMFWARVDAISPLLEADLQWHDFPAEEGQTDGTLAHCVERMLGAVPTSRNRLIGIIRDTTMPSWSRWRLNQFFDRPLELTHGAITAPQTRVVAFDIFDTLITRPFLDADYVKQLLDVEYHKRGIANFREIRGRSEAAAREAKGADVDLYEIYQNLNQQAGVDASELSPDKEIELEARSVRPRSEVIDLIDFAKRSGKRVILASDMFLPRSVIEDMLERCGVSGWDALYLSSEVGLRKDSGKLYEHILAEENIAPAQMLMIGDNERSDLQIPSDMGFQTIHVVKPTQSIRAIPRFANLVPNSAHAPVEDQFLFGAIASANFGPISYPNFSADDMFSSSAWSVGYSLLGPIAVGFSQWLVDQARAEKIDCLYFLAREGKFLKTAFDRWQISATDQIKSEYLLISRRAVTVPCIESMEDILAIASSNDFYGASMDLFLLERFGVTLDAATWTEVQNRNLWQKSTPLNILGRHITHIVPFLRFVSPKIFEQAKSERRSALKYYGRAGLTTNERVSVVDVGYGGTIQRHLLKLLERKVDGLYMMTNVAGQSLAASADVVARGYFADGAAGDWPMLRHSFVLEKLLSADDEQVISYSKSGEAQFRERGDYLDQGKDVRMEVQRGALAFIDEAVRFRDEMNTPLRLSKSHCEELYCRFVSQMSPNEKEIFSQLALDDYYCGRGIVTE